MKKLYVTKPKGDDWIFIFFISDTEVANRIGTLEDIPFSKLLQYAVGDPNMLFVSCYWDKRKTLKKLEKEFEVIDAKEYIELTKKLNN